MKAAMRPSALVSSAAAIMALMGCGAAQEDALSVEYQPVALFPDDPGRRVLGDLRYGGGLALSSADERFGGWSALEVSADGSRILAISDRAYWMAAQLDYDAAGELSGVSDVEITAMLDASGAALSGERADAEGLADLGEGRYAVSFERDHRIDVYEIAADWSALAGATPAPLPAPPGADRLRNNAGTEALARLGDTLWAAIEYPIMDGQPNTLWRYDLNRLDIPPVSAALSLAPGFGLTGLAPDGEGGLVVIERFYARSVGNRIKIGQLNRGDLEGDGPASPQILAMLEPGMSLDNFEAAAVHGSGPGRRLLILSDDNFNDEQRTLLMSFHWPQDSAAD